jgi:transcription antitermination factor NusG
MTKGPRTDLVDVQEHADVKGGFSTAAKMQALNLSLPAAQSRIAEHRVGQSVQIKAGILRGLQGTIVRRSESGRVLLRVECFGEQVCVQVMENLLEPAP